MKNVKNNAFRPYSHSIDREIETPEWVSWAKLRKKKVEWGKTTVGSPPRVLSERGFHAQIPMSGKEERRLFYPVPVLHAHAYLQNLRETFSLPALTKFSAWKSEEIIAWAQAKASSWQVFAGSRLPLSSLPMDFSADLLHPAISGLALPRVETANCADLGQTIWGVVWSGETSQWLAFKTKMTPTPHLSVVIWAGLEPASKEG